MTGLPSVLVLTGDNNEIERFLKSLVANGLVENTLRRYSSSKIDLSALGELVFALQKAREEVERIAPERARLKNSTKMAEVTALKERIGVLEHSLEEVQEANARLKGILSECSCRIFANFGADNILYKKITDILKEV